MIATFTALAEPNRLRIVELLRHGPRTVGDIGSALGVRQPQVSKHLKLLKDAGLVDVEARAQARIYGLRAAPLVAMHHWLEDYRAVWDERFDALDAVLVDLQRQEQQQQQQRTRAPSTRPQPPARAPQSKPVRENAKETAAKARTTGARPPARSPTRRRP